MPRDSTPSGSCRPRRRDRSGGRPRSPGSPSRCRCRVQRGRGAHGQAPEDRRGRGHGRDVVAGVRPASRPGSGSGEEELRVRHEADGRAASSRRARRRLAARARPRRAAPAHARPRPPDRHAEEEKPDRRLDGRAGGQAPQVDGDVSRPPLVGVLAQQLPNGFARVAGGVRAARSRSIVSVRSSAIGLPRSRAPRVAPVPRPGLYDLSSRGRPVSVRRAERSAAREAPASQVRGGWPESTTS